MCMMIRDKYINPFTDFGFKWLFGTEENKELLISFLNDLLDIEYKIVDIEYRNLEKLGLNIIDRRAIFDIYCKDERGDSFIVELQRSRQEYFKDRSIYYTSFPIQEQSKKGVTWGYNLKKIFFIAILEFKMDDNPNYLTKVQLHNCETKEVFYDKLTYYYIEMPKFKKSEAELKDHLEYWLYALNNMSNLKAIPTKFKEDKLINKAFNVAEFLALDKDSQFRYQHDLKIELDNRAVMSYAKKESERQGLVEGKKQGLIEGKREGLVEGKREGLVEGKKEAKIEVAKNLLDILDTETISKKTGLEIDEIESLKKSEGFSN